MISLRIYQNYFNYDLSPLMQWIAKNIFVEIVFSGFPVLVEIIVMIAVLGLKRGI
jgi:hypothetical protein